jgi:hypothetical protein
VLKELLDRLAHKVNADQLELQDLLVQQEQIRSDHQDLKDRKVLPVYKEPEDLREPQARQVFQDHQDHQDQIR